RHDPRQDRRVSVRSILVYHPEPGDALAYAGRIVQPRLLFTVAAGATLAEASVHVADAEILYAWNFPRELLPKATMLGCVQNMGAGVERFLVPELPPGVKLTRVAGIFGPWMAEYVLGWCLWSTQRTELFRARQRERRWQPTDPLRLHGSTMCVVGLGDIGRLVPRARRAFRIRVTGVTQPGPTVAEAARAEGGGGGARLPDARSPEGHRRGGLRGPHGAADAGNPPPRGDRGARGHEALGVAPQHCPRPHRGFGRAGGGAGRTAHRRCRA